MARGSCRTVFRGRVRSGGGGVCFVDPVVLTTRCRRCPRPRPRRPRSFRRAVDALRLTDTARDLSPPFTVLCPPPLPPRAPLAAGGRHRVRGLRLGIVGLGRIGTATALRAAPFGFQTAFYDPYVRGGMEKVAQLRHFLGVLDCVACCLALCRPTRHPR